MVIRFCAFRTMHASVISGALGSSFSVSVIDFPASCRPGSGIAAERRTLCRSLVIKEPHAEDGIPSNRSDPGVGRPSDCLRCRN